MMLVILVFALVLPHLAFSDSISQRAAEFIPSNVEAANNQLHKWLSPEQQLKKYSRDINDFLKFEDKSKLPQTVFTWKEVAKYNGEGDQPLYLVIGEGVYDLTLIGDLHPGGSAPLKKHAGQDATAFLCNMNVPEAMRKAVLHRFQVGTMVPNSTGQD